MGEYIGERERRRGGLGDRQMFASIGSTVIFSARRGDNTTWHDFNPYLRHSSSFDEPGRIGTGSGAPLSCRTVAVAEADSGCNSIRHGFMPNLAHISSDVAAAVRIDRLVGASLGSCRLLRMFREVLESCTSLWVDAKRLLRATRAAVVTVAFPPSGWVASASLCAGASRLLRFVAAVVAAAAT